MYITYGHRSPPLVNCYSYFLNLLNSAARCPSSYQLHATNQEMNLISESLRIF